MWDKIGEVFGDVLFWGKREVLMEGCDVSCYGV